MRVGVCLLPTDPWPETVARARRLEALGYDHLWTYDHLSWRRYREEPWFAAMPWLTGVAMATKRVRLGPLVASPNFRHPYLFAKEAMTLDHISGGRLILGIGAGGPGFDATVLGGAAADPRQRVARLREFVEVVDDALRNPTVSFRGEYFAVDDARMIPGCVQQPRVPLAVAASGPRSLEIVAQYADAWVTVGAYADGLRDRLAERCAHYGRDIADLDLILLADESEDRPLAGVDAFGDYVERYAALGYTDIVFHYPRPGDPIWTDPESMVERAAEVLPDLR